MSVDKEWFTRKIQETPQGSLRGVARAMKGRSGGTMEASSLVRMLSGEREMLLSEAVQLADILGVSIEQIILHTLGPRNRR